MKIIEKCGEASRDEDSVEDRKCQEMQDKYKACLLKGYGFDGHSFMHEMSERSKKYIL